MRTGPTPLIAVGFAASLALWRPATGHASTPAPDEADPGALIESLDSPSLLTREAAMHALIDSALPVEPVAHAALSEGSLTAEQVVRLETALQERFGQAPRAALGIQFAQNVPGAAIVERVVPNFPAADHLQPGDVIVEVDGENARTGAGQRTVQATILAHDPGETMRIVVLRNGRPVAMLVPLGSFENLDNPAGNNPPEDRLRDAWRIRRQRMGFALYDAPLIDCGGDGRFEDQFLPARAVPDLEAGGVPDNGAAMRQELHAANSGLARTATRRNNAGANARPRLEARQVDTPGTNAGRDELVQRLRATETAARAHRARLERMAPSAPGRDEVERAARLMEAEALMLRERIARMADAQPAPPPHERDRP